VVYNTQNCSVFGLCSSSSILETRKHNVSETGSVPVHRGGGGGGTLLGLLERANLNQKVKVKVIESRQHNNWL
jgi:hypothetical protein